MRPQRIFVSRALLLAVELHRQQENRREVGPGAVFVLPFDEAEGEIQSVNTRLSVVRAVPVPDRLEPLLQLLFRKQNAQLVVFVMVIARIVAGRQVEGRVDPVGLSKRLHVQGLAVFQMRQTQLLADP